MLHVASLLVVHGFSNSYISWRTWRQSIHPFQGRGGAIPAVLGREASYTLDRSQGRLRINVLILKKQDSWNKGAAERTSWSGMSWFLLHVKCPHQSKLRTYLRVCMVILSKYNKFKVWNCRWSWSVFRHVCGLVFLSLGSRFNPKNYLQVSSNIRRYPSVVQWRKLNLHQVTYNFNCFFIVVTI